MKVFISSADFKFDVDHMPGVTLQKSETIHDNLKKWKEHADVVNSKVYEDEALISNTALYTKYVSKGKRFAYWDKVKKIGTVNNKGEQLQHGR